MAFRARNPACQKAYDTIKERAVALEDNLILARAAMVQPTCVADVPLAVIANLGRFAVEMQILIQTPGLADYAKAQENDSTYDVVAEFQAMRAAVISARDQLMNDFPKSATAPNYILHKTFNPDGSTTSRTFTAAQLATAVGLIDNVMASIE